MDSTRSTEARPLGLEFARQRVVAAVTALGECIDSHPAPNSALKAQQALIVARLESLSDHVIDADAPSPRSRPERFEFDKWIDGLPLPD
jgi:hypothetical protein